MNNTRPLVPTDIKPDRSIIRACIARVVAARGEVEPGDVMRRHWPHDRVGLALAESRSTTSVATTSTWGEPIANTATAAFVRSLAPRSAAARLIEAGVKVDLTSGSQVSVPFLGTG